MGTLFRRTVRLAVAVGAAYVANRAREALHAPRETRREAQREAPREAPPDTQPQVTVGVSPAAYPQVASVTSSSFGPAPVQGSFGPAPVRSVGFIAPAPVAEMPVVFRPGRGDVPEPLPTPAPVPEPTPTPEPSAEDDLSGAMSFVGPVSNAEPVDLGWDTPVPSAPAVPVSGGPVSGGPVSGGPVSGGPGTHKRVGAALSGQVTNSHGRGLRFVEARLIDLRGALQATTETGESGRFHFEDVEPGRYRLVVSDEYDDLHERRWFGGAEPEAAAEIRVKKGRKVRHLQLTLRSNADITATALTTGHKIRVTVDVAVRATGAPARGRVRIRGGHLDSTIALRKGTAELTVDRAASALRAGRKLRVDYLGNRHTAPASLKVKQRKKKAKKQPKKHH